MRHPRMLLHELQKISALQKQTQSRFQSDRVTRPRLAVQQCELTEELPSSEQRERHLLTVFCRQTDLDRPRLDQEQVAPQIAVQEDHLAFAIAPPTQPRVQLRTLRLVQSREERHFLEQRGGSLSSVYGQR